MTDFSQPVQEKRLSMLIEKDSSEKLLSFFNLWKIISLLRTWG